MTQKKTNAHIHRRRKKNKWNENYFCVFVFLSVSWGIHNIYYTIHVRSYTHPSIHPAIHLIHSNILPTKPIWFAFNYMLIECNSQQCKNECSRKSFIQIECWNPLKSFASILAENMSYQQKSVLVRHKRMCVGFRDTLNSYSSYWCTQLEIRAWSAAEEEPHRKMKRTWFLSFHPHQQRNHHNVQTLKSKNSNILTCMSHQ